MNLSDKLDLYSKKQINKICKIVIDWHFNRKCNNMINTKLKILKSCRTDIRGSYTSSFNNNPAIIRIYYRNIENLSDLIFTVLHECRHAIHPDHEYNELLDKLTLIWTNDGLKLTNGYSTHPMEMDANDFAKKNLLKAWKQVTKKFEI